MPWFQFDQHMNIDNHNHWVGVADQRWDTVASFFFHGRTCRRPELGHLDLASNPLDDPSFLSQ